MNKKELNKNCKHNWKIIEDTISIEHSLFFKRKYYTQIYVIQCKKCGELKYAKHYLGNEFNQNQKPLK